MNAITTTGTESVAAPTAEDDADVLALCEIWRALDFPEDDGCLAVVPPEPTEVP